MEGGVAVLRPWALSQACTTNDLYTRLKCRLLMGKAHAATKAAARIKGLHCYCWLAADRHQSN
nr:MAG TPA_asm: hypothetical protein [Caudoviricetes sp.]